jgi:hypothetical protein
VRPRPLTLSVQGFRSPPGSVCRLPRRRRKGAPRPSGMGLRPTLPPPRRSRIEAGYGERVGGVEPAHAHLAVGRALDFRDGLISKVPSEAGMSPTLGNSSGLRRHASSRTGPRSAHWLAGEAQREPSVIANDTRLDPTRDRQRRASDSAEDLLTPGLQPRVPGRARKFRRSGAVLSCRDGHGAPDKGADGGQNEVTKRLI